MILNDNTNNSTTIDNEELIIGKQQYKGSAKLVWEDGRQIIVPRLASLSNHFVTVNW